MQYVASRRVVSCITALALCGAFSADAAVVVHLTFDEGAGIALKDASGNQHDATIKDAASPKWVAGILGKAIDFDGSYYADVPLKFPVPGSVSLWYCIKSFYNYNAVLDNSNEGSTDPSNDWEMWIQGANINQPWYKCPYCWKMHLGGSVASRDAGKVEFDVRALSGGDMNRALNKWYHAVATWNAQGVTILYINGLPRDTAQSADWKPAGNHIYLAANQAGNVSSCPDCGSHRHGTGAMDEFVVFDQALSPQQVDSVYQATVTGAGSGSYSLSGSRLGPTAAIDAGEWFSPAGRSVARPPADDGTGNRPAGVVIVRTRSALQHGRPIRAVRF